MSIYEYDAEKVQRQFREQWKQMDFEIAAHILQLSRQGKSAEEIVAETGESIEIIKKLLGE